MEKGMRGRPSQDSPKLCKAIEGDALIRFDEFQGEHHPLSVTSMLLAAVNFDALETMRIPAHP
jgi:hypothetical protein